MEDNITIAGVYNNKYHMKENESKISFEYFDEENRIYFDGNIYIDFIINDKDKAKRIVVNKLNKLT